MFLEGERKSRCLPNFLRMKISLSDITEIIAAPENSNPNRKGIETIAKDEV